MEKQKSHINSVSPYAGMRQNQLITGHFNAQIHCMTDGWEEVMKAQDS